MPNPQDSPKTLEELVGLLRRIYNPGVWTQRQLDAAVQLIQSFIDAQKAEVTEGHAAFAKALVAKVLPEANASIKHGHAQSCPKCDRLVFESFKDGECAFCMIERRLAQGLRDLVQEAVKPWKAFAYEAVAQIQELINLVNATPMGTGAMGILSRNDWADRAAIEIAAAEGQVGKFRALLSQPQEVK